jgi:hypothetical protein
MRKHTPLPHSLHNVCLVAFLMACEAGQNATSPRQLTTRFWQASKRRHCVNRAMPRQAGRLASGFRLRIEAAGGYYQNWLIEQVAGQSLSATSRDDRMPKPTVTPAILAVILSVLCAKNDGPASAADFVRDVKPILVQRCFRCHSSLEQESGLRVDSAAAILKGGDGGQIVVPGQSADSRLIAAVEQRGDLKMPPEGAPLSAAEIAVLRDWIDAGAFAPAGGEDSKTDHWAFKRPLRPELPRPADPTWAENPIDAFVASRHAELKLMPVGEAPPNLLLRRLSIDLVGLPPSAPELHDLFLSHSPTPPLSHSAAREGAKGREGEWESKYMATVDQLLASPEYGERWGRHWMDVWRYSDWDGYNSEIRESKPHIWRWRDWIVESLNADKPYDRMVQEMLAADEFAPHDPEALRATGYLVRSWYKFNRNKWLDDVVEHTGKAFLGLTFNCCRCHDHMYDPL